MFHQIIIFFTCSTKSSSSLHVFQQVIITFHQSVIIFFTCSTNLQIIIFFNVFKQVIITFHQSIILTSLHVSPNPDLLYTCHQIIKITIVFTCVSPNHHLHHMFYQIIIFFMCISASNHHISPKYHLNIFTCFTKSSSCLHMPSNHQIIIFFTCSTKSSSALRASTIIIFFTCFTRSSKHHLLYSCFTKSSNQTKCFVHQTKPNVLFMSILLHQNHCLLCFV